MTQESTERDPQDNISSPFESPESQLPHTHRSQMTDQRMSRVEEWEDQAKKEVKGILGFDEKEEEASPSIDNQSVETYHEDTIR